MLDGRTLRVMAFAAVANVLFQLSRTPAAIYGRASYPIKDAPPEVCPTKLSFEGPFSPNEVLKGVDRLLEDVAVHAETILFDSQGKMYMLHEGDIFASEADGSNRTLYAHTGGRPLGGKFDTHGNLIFADLAKGLCMVEAGSRRVVFLTDRVSSSSPLQPNSPINYADDVDIAADGTIYFSDATMLAPAKFGNGMYDTLGSAKTSFYQGPTGRLLSYEPSSGATHVLAAGLYFANGVALSEDESFLVVASTFSSCLFRFWLKGSKAGTLEQFATLPGSPDGVSQGSDGSFWVALPSPTLGVVEFAAPYTLLRWALSWIPEDLAPKPVAVGMVVQIDKNGQRC